jgi:hypothetical protein
MPKTLVVVGAVLLSLRLESADHEDKAIYYFTPV